MRKKIISIGIVMIVFFSFAGCVNIEDYKADAKAELDTYLYELYRSVGQELFGSIANFNIDGPVSEKIISEGKAFIEKSSNKKDVDAALKTAKRELETIPIVFPMSLAPLAYSGEAWGYQFTFYLKIFDDNVFFVCTANEGEILSSPPSDTSLAPVYDVFYGREPQVAWWFIERVEFDQGGFDILFEQDFIDFIIKIDDAIIGYMVVEMNYVSNGYVPKLLTFTLNPKINGEYESMNENEVKNEIETIKEKYKNIGEINYEN